MVEKVSFRSAPVWLGLGLLIPLLFVLLGAAQTWGTIRALCLAKQSATWPVVRGVVTAVAYDADGDGIEYRYTVEGRPLVSTRISFLEGRRRASRGLVRYRPGDEVGVHHAPRAPEQSVLEPGGSLGDLGLSFYLFLSFVPLGATTLVLLVRRIDWRE